MSKHPYTASERRGIIAIAVMSLLIIGAGLGLSLCNRNSYSGFSDSEVIEDTSMIDSVAIEKSGNTSSHKKSNKKVKKKSTPGKNKKTYRRRSPLDEPV